MSTLTPYNSMHCTYMTLVLHVSSTAIKIPAEPHHAIDILFICTLRHGGSAEPALPAARRIRLVSEKEKRNSPGIHSCSQLNHCPKGKTSYIRIFMQKTGSHMAQESQGSGRGLWTHRNQTILFSGSMF